MSNIKVVHFLEGLSKRSSCQTLKIFSKKGLSTKEKLKISKLGTKRKYQIIWKSRKHLTTGCLLIDIELLDQASMLVKKCNLSRSKVKNDIPTSLPSLAQLMDLSGKRCHSISTPH